MWQRWRAKHGRAGDWAADAASSEQALEESRLFMDEIGAITFGRLGTMTEATLGEARIILPAPMNEFAGKPAGITAAKVTGAGVALVELAADPTHKGITVDSSGIGGASRRCDERPASDTRLPPDRKSGSARPT
jgi:hypothetical protein